MSNVLDKVDLPTDVKKLSAEDLGLMAEELRDLIIETISKTGGHLAANLGTVELTVALLRIFSPPTDKIVWDVGHQAYSYKILTGRKERFGTLRQAGGISGFLRREESPYDAFGAGHSGTAISAALGMAAARDRRGSDEHVVAVLGDGSLGNGISLEALNNLATTTKRLVVVLNDNEMSISANVGAVARYLGGLLANPRYNRWKTSVEGVAKYLGLGLLRNVYYRIEELVKSLFLRSIIFEELGMRYVGPIDGHNLPALISAFEIASNYQKPILLHVATQKGKGYSFAEQHPEKWHGTSPFDVRSGKTMSKSGALTYSQVFGKAMEQIAGDDARLVGITAAMAAGTGLSGFAERFPERFFDVGISEEHAVVFAAGLASEGLVPVVALYSTFAQRAVDCVIHDVCLQNLPVILCLDRAGIVGDDGPTHHGIFDMALFRPIPNLIIMQPANERELGDMLQSAVSWGRPAVIRYPRGIGPGVDVPEECGILELGKAAVLTGEKPDVWVWALGDMISLARQVSDLLEGRGVKCGVVNARFIKPLDSDLLRKHAGEASVIVTLENGMRDGGFGSAVEEEIVATGLGTRVLREGWPDKFVQHGKPESLMKQYGLTGEAIVNRVTEVLSSQ